MKAVIILAAFAVGVGQQIINAPLDVDTEMSVTKCNLTFSSAFAVPGTLVGIYTCPNDTLGQYVYVSSDMGPLTVYAVYIMANNLAYSKSAWKIPTDSNNDANIAVDCKFGFGMRDFTQQTQTATGDNPFWAMDLGDVYKVQEVSFTPADNSRYM